MGVAFKNKVTTRTIVFIKYLCPIYNLQHDPKKQISEKIRDENKSPRSFPPLLQCVDKGTERKTLWCFTTTRLPTHPPPFSAKSTRAHVSCNKKKKIRKKRETHLSLSLTPRTSTVPNFQRIFTHALYTEALALVSFSPFLSHVE